MRKPPVASETAESPYWPSRQYKTRLNLRFPGDLAQQLEDYCRRQGLSKQDATEIAIRRLLAEDRVASRTPGHPQSGHPQTGHQVGWVPDRPHDHDHDEDDRIILYQQMTGNRINARDRAAFAEVRHLHTDVIREGIRLSLERAPAPVKSFRYCLGAINEVASRGTATLPPKRPTVPDVAPPATLARTFDETVMLARAVARQLRHDQPSVGWSEVREHLHSWAAAQGVYNAEAVIEAALAAEGLAP
jgi:hypothetical protein